MLNAASGVFLSIIKDDSFADGVNKNVINVVLDGSSLDTAQVTLEITSGSAVFFESGDTKITLDIVAAAVINQVLGVNYFCQYASTTLATL